MVNRGVFMTPGDEEQWTLSVQHTEADIDRYVDAFAEFCAAVALLNLPTHRRLPPNRAPGHSRSRSWYHQPPTGSSHGSEPAGARAATEVEERRRTSSPSPRRHARARTIRQGDARPQ